MSAPNIDPKVAKGITTMVGQIRRGISETLCRLSRGVTEGGLDSHDLHGLFVALDGASAIRIEMGMSEHEGDDDSETEQEGEAPPVARCEDSDLLAMASKAREAITEALMLVGCGDDPAKSLCVALSNIDAIESELETDDESEAQS